MWLILCLELVAAAHWQALEEGENQACRHTKSWVTYEGYFGKHFCTLSLADCQKHCENTANCKGVEYSADWSWADLGPGGRCEVWFVDINVTSTVPSSYQVTCLRYYENPLEPTELWFSEEEGACRGANSSDSSTCYYSAHSTQHYYTSYHKMPKLTLEDCKKRCSYQKHCTGIEFKEDTGYCEVWKVPINAVQAVPGYKCYKVVPPNIELPPVVVP